MLLRQKLAKEVLSDHSCVHTSLGSVKEPAEVVWHKKLLSRTGVAAVCTINKGESRFPKWKMPKLAGGEGE